MAEFVIYERETPYDGGGDPRQGMRRTEISIGGTLALLAPPDGLPFGVVVRLDRRGRAGQPVRRPAVVCVPEDRQPLSTDPHSVYAEETADVGQGARAALVSAAADAALDALYYG